MSMDHPEGLGSASASEVPTRPPGPGYNFRPRSRSATAPKNRRLGPVELQGVGSTLDLPSITPPISPTPSGAGNPIHVNFPTQKINTEIISHDSTTSSSPPFSQLMPDTVAAGMNFPLSTLMPNPIAAGVSTDNNTSEFGTRNVGVESYNFAPIPNTVTTEKLYSTLMPETAGIDELLYSTHV